MSFVSWIKYGLLKQPKPMPTYSGEDYLESLVDCYCLGRAGSGHNTYLDIKKNLGKDEWKYLGRQYKKLTKEVSLRGQKPQ